jgi:glycosyltransferase involved in cell wall biosynthesis
MTGDGPSRGWLVHTSAAMPGPPPLRVRTARGYWLPFVVDLGQRNAVIVSRPWTPLERVGGGWMGSFAVLPEPDFDAIHALNAVPVLTRRPYIVTFEDHLPRLFDSPVPQLAGWLRQQLTRPRCIALLAMSEYAVRQFRAQNRDAPELRQLEAKLEVLRPGVALRRERPKQHAGDALRLVFVGKDFYRKGGPALLRAHHQLRQAGVPVQTTVVSSLAWSPDDYVGPSSAAYVEAERARLGQEGVVHHPGLSNAETLRLIADADFLVLPTLHDTFGFVSLEALSTGTPVIATDTCVQPEIVEPGRSGYLVPLESDGEVGKWPWLERRFDPEYQGAYEDAIERLATSLTAVLAGAWDARADYEAMSAGALDQVRRRFDRDRVRLRLEALYDRMRAHRFGPRGV